jgi:hypothetical protein
MCKEMPVIPVNRVVDPKKNNWKKWRAKEEERYKGSLTPKNVVHDKFRIGMSNPLVQLLNCSCGLI